MEIQKHQATTKAHIETLQQLSGKETKLSRIEGQWKSWCDCLEDSHVSNSTQLQELNIKLQEQEQVLTNRQVEEVTKLVAQGEEKKKEEKKFEKKRDEESTKMDNDVEEVRPMVTGAQESLSQIPCPPGLLGQMPGGIYIPFSMFWICDVFFTWLDTPRIPPQ
ncbi:uncharacterized protein LOC119010966 isoform X2 [Acanthopagrus latus]|nr:uncharacterized protein LOC119010966 isoform X2 [Acanthopagrus latus]